MWVKMSFQPEADPPLAEWGGLGRGEYHPHLTSPIKGEGLKEKLFQKLNTSFLIYVNKLS